ncbi:hypothetical protein [Actinotalea fermentans]|uniref:hypothetical protein n=1 Tax=Actinotalea fermentans TaxID=43671 RepID=UPI0011BD662F|nr:hypothetical protein [Actinotalea fermentans]
MLALTSLLCSAVTEGISQLFTKRAKDLLRGIADMLDVPPEHKTSTFNRARQLSRETLKPVDLTKVRQVPPGAQPPVPGPAAVAAPAAPPGPAAVAAPAAPPGPPANPALPAGPDSTWTVQLYQHPLIRALQTPRLFPWTAWRRNPQYIPGRTFARALVALLLRGDPKDPVEAIHASIEKIGSTHPARRALEPLFVQAEKDLDKFQTAIEEWYDAQMGRLSGAYKRWSQVILAGVGLVAAVGLNINLVAITQTLWSDEAVRTVVVENAVDGTLCEGTEGQERLDCINDELGALGAAGMPIGWESGAARPWDDGTLGVAILGWLLTAMAVSFGAPFWFDTLSKLGSLRSAGPREPSTTTTESTA